MCSNFYSFGRHIFNLGATPYNLDIDSVVNKPTLYYINLDVTSNILIFVEQDCSYPTLKKDSVTVAS
jgi:hypothetical protein